VVARGTLAELGEGDGRFVVANAPYKLSATPLAARRRLAGLGEHSAEVMAQVLGLPEGQISELRAQGVFGAVR
jgi:crotonobetainyl-CoA:carnitine CoA-transferase CaiB-like acyl-CoA transferase